MEWVIERVGKIDKRYKITFVSACIIGLLTHMFMFTNLLPGNDETMFYFRLGGTCSFGRWGLQLLLTKIPFLDVSLNTCFGMPWVKGSVSIIFLALVSCCVVDILNIRNKYLCILIGGGIITYPSVAATFSYMFTSSAYFWGLLLACLAVLISQKGWEKGSVSSRVLSCCGSALLLMFSLSIYQAYICFAIGLFVADLIRQCVDSDKSWKELLGTSLFYLGTIVAGLILYYFSIQIMLAYFWPSLASYQGIDEMMNGGAAKYIEVFISGVKRAYKSFYSVPFVWGEALQFRKILYAVIRITSAVCILVQIGERREYKSLKSVLLLVLILLFPIAAFSVYLLGSAGVSTLMLYGTIVPLFLSVSLIDDKLNAEEWSLIGKKIWRVSREIIIVCVTVLVCQYYLVTNEAYNRQFFTYEQTYGYFNRVAYSIENTEGYTQDMPVMLLGNVEKAVTMPQFEALDHITGIFGESALVNGYSREEFIRRYCGLPFKIATEQEREAVKESKEYAQMPCYPENGSVSIIEECLVVKFSE